MWQCERHRGSLHVTSHTLRRRTWNPTLEGLMITNPFDQVPFDPSQALAWGQGFLFSLTGPLASTEQAPDSIADDVRDAFEKGVLAGQQAAIDGLDIFPHASIPKSQNTSPSQQNSAWKVPASSPISCTAPRWPRPHSARSSWRLLISRSRRTISHLRRRS